ncbi:MAG: MBOAT family protein, partial [Calditerrivibrio sp.]|nr:MBOAT family protein [Calditerrivibrio sp.]
MLFNSHEFIFLFLPISLVVYFILNRLRLTLASKTWLVVMSLIFYSWWDVKYLPLILGSMTFNYA